MATAAFPGSSKGRNVTFHSSDKLPGDWHMRCSSKEEEAVTGGGIS